jgi:hypothetical protein
VEAEGVEALEAAVAREVAASAVGPGRRKSALIEGMGADAKVRELGAFREALENGVSVVKFNRRGKVAVRTLMLVGAHTLTWRGDGKKGKLTATKKGDLFDLRALRLVQLGEEPDALANVSGTSAAMAGASSSLRSASPPRSSASMVGGGGGDEPALLGTATLRMHVAKHAGLRAMRDGQQCASLVFAERSVDFGCDNASQRNMLAQGFRLLREALPAAAAAATSGA